MEIIKLDATTSEAKILSETKPGTITINARAVEVAHCYEEMRLGIYLLPSIPVDECKELIRAIGLSPFLVLREEAEKADICVYLVPQRPVVSPTSLVPQLGLLSEDTWALIGRDGYLVAPVHRMSEHSAISLLCSNLEKIARYRHTVALRNDNAANPLRDKIEFTLLKLGADGSWQPAILNPQSSQTIYREGERIAMRVVNHHSSPLYISILDFGLTGKITQIYPIEGAHEALAPGIPFFIGARKEEHHRVSFPDDYLYTAEHNHQKLVSDTEIVKLIATTHEADFSWLVQGTLRSTSQQPTVSPLEQLLAMALMGQGKRDITETRIAAQEEWTTLERCFFLLNA